MEGTGQGGKRDSCACHAPRTATGMILPSAPRLKEVCLALVDRCLGYVSIVL